jgi:hypothetical protein
MIMDLEATIRRQREAIQSLSGLIGELMFYVNADDFGSPLTDDPQLNESERIQLRDRVEATMNQLIDEGLIDPHQGNSECV